MPKSNKDILYRHKYTVMSEVMLYSLVTFPVGYLERMRIT
jgi:hypothetical protein